MKILALALTLTATFGWATSQVIGKVVLRKITPLFFNTFRFTVATAIVAVGVLLFGRIEGFSFSLPFFAAIASGILGWFVAAFLFTYVLQRDAAYRVIPTGNAYPFWAILLGTTILGEDITMLIPVSAVFVFSGTYLLAKRREGDDEGWKYGVPAASLVAFLWGFNAILNRFALIHGIGRIYLLFLRLLTATIFFWLAILFLKRQDLEFHKKRSVGLSALSGIIAFPVGSLAYVSALNIEEASTLAPVTGSTVMFGFILSVIFLNEEPSKEAAIGMVSIFLGILLMI